MSQRVGILTFHNVANYGAMLQAYAVQEAVRQLGGEPTIIDYRQKSVTRLDRHYGLRSGTFISTMISRWRFHRFLKSCLEVGSTRYDDPESLRANPPRFDVVVCGSDQIWNIKKTLGFDPSYFLDFAQATGARCVSYAPSVGGIQDFGEHRESVNRLLKGFSHISARDQRTKQMIQEVSGRDVTHVLDPTFLVDFEPLVIQPKRPRDYIVTYCLARTPAFDQTVALLKARINLPVVAISPRHSGWTVNGKAAGPREWLGYMRNARYVCTNSFHGTVFSLKFGKSFIVPPRSENQTRIDDLLQTVGLSDRIVRDAATLSEKPDAFWDFDYQPVNAILEREIESSRNYLRDALAPAATTAAIAE